MTARRFWAAALLMLGACLFAEPARNASVFEELVSPGPVIQGHAKVEKACASCHKPFDKSAQRGLCLGCHKPIAADIANKKGFHGRQKGMAEARCAGCHTDHIGRSARIISLDERAFDHALTDFLLEGGHAKPACKACHAEGKKFREAPTACIGCHRKDDTHKGALGDDCKACHSAERWKAIRFDHDRDTKYPLTGLHRKVTCAGCHLPGRTAKGTATACFACHGAKDPHKGKLGRECQACHVTESWKRVSFDHGQSAFPLLGKHAKAKCADCHKTPDYKATPIACIACHQDKHHGGRLGRDCGACHNAVDWKRYRFNHARDAHYALTGRHGRIACTTCHTAVFPPTLRLPTACLDCHRDDDVHHGKFGADCAACHRTSMWKKAYIKP